MFEKRPASFYIFLALTAITIVAYWQVAFLQNCLKWDMLGCYLPWRYHVGECLQNGIFPFWNPYTHLGYPIYADLRSVWYPETFIIGLTTGYSYLTMHLLFILHISLAGFGMFLLCRHFTDDWRAGFIAGAAYIMSGFFVGHGQEMFGIIAATWIPYVLYYFIRLQKERKYIDVARTAVFSFLLVTGGYQAMWAILLYLLFTLFIVYLLKYLKNRNRSELWQFLKVNIILVILTGLSLTVIAVTFFQVSSQVGRMGGVSLEEAWFIPFSPRSLISFFTPFATVKDLDWYGTDISMNNAYVGLITLIFFLASLFSKKKALLNTFLIFGLVALLASFGKYTPVRALLYDVFPLFDLFRHSSFFVYFVVLALIPAAASGLGMFFSDPDTYRKKLFIIAGVVGLILILLLINSLPLVNIDSFSFFKPVDDFTAWLKLATRHEHVVINTVIQLVFLLLFVFFVLLPAGARLNLLIILFLTEMFVSVQLNTYYTVVTAGTSPIAISHNLQLRSPGFPLPVSGLPVSINTDKTASYSVILQNTNIFNKTVSIEGYNSFRLNGFESLTDSFPDLANAVIKNEIIFLSGEILPFNKYHPGRADSIPSVLYINAKEVPDYLTGLQSSEKDSVVITGFHPGYVEALVKSSGKVAVTLLQSVYPGWKVTIDGKESLLFVSDKTLISTICGPGTHTVRFIYDNQPVVFGFILSYGIIFILLTILVYFSMGKRNKSFKLSVIAIILLIIASLSFYRFNPGTSYEKEKIRIYNDAADRIVRSGVMEVVCNIDDQELMEDAFSKAGYHGRYFKCNLTYQSGLRKMIDHIDSLKTEKIAFLNLYAPVPEVSDAAFRVNWQGHSERRKLKNGSLQFFSESSDIRGFSSLNNYEKPVSGWNLNPLCLDSLNSLSGRFSNHIDSLNMGSSSYIWKPHSMQVNRPFEVFVKAKILGEFSGAALYIQNHSDGKMVRNFGFNAGTWQFEPEKWSGIVGYGRFPAGVSENDEIRVFFWGSKQSDFYIDDFSVTIWFSEK